MKGNIFILNQGAENLTGYTAEEVIGKIHITKFYSEGVAKDIMKKLRSPDYGGVGKLNPSQLNLVSKNGEDSLGFPRHSSMTVPAKIASVDIFTDLGHVWPWINQKPSAW